MYFAEWKRKDVLDLFQQQNSTEIFTLTGNDNTVDNIWHQQFNFSVSNTFPNLAIFRIK